MYCNMGGDHGDDSNSLGETTKRMLETMARELPIHGVSSFTTQKISYEALEKIVERMNNAQPKEEN